MSYYNWEKIVSSYSENELKVIFREKDKEPEEKVRAVVAELIKRGVLTADEKYIPEPTLQECIIKVSKITRTKSNFKSSRKVILFLFIIISFDILSIISSLLRLDIYNSIKDGLFISKEMVYYDIIRELLILVAYFNVYILAMIFFIIWFTRAYINLHKRISRCENPIWWAVAGWFIPFMSFFRPYEIMKELIKKTTIIIKERGLLPSKTNKQYFLGIWWTFCISTQLISRNTYGIFFSNETADSHIYCTILNIITSCIDIIFIILTIRIVKEFSICEELLFKNENDFNVN